MSREPLSKKSKNAGPSQGAHVSQRPLPTHSLDVAQRATQQGESIAAQSLLDLQHSAGFDDDLYYKLIPSDGGKAYHCYAYFKWGQWAGHYVYALAVHGDLAGALTALARKVREVRAGSRKATLDAKKGSPWQKGR